MHKQCKTESLVNASSVDKSKRTTLETIGKGVLLGTSIIKAPYVFARQKHTLRVLGTHVTLQVFCNADYSPLRVLIFMNNGPIVFDRCGEIIRSKQLKPSALPIGMKSIRYVKRVESHQKQNMALVTHLLKL